MKSANIKDVFTKNVIVEEDILKIPSISSFVEELSAVDGPRVNSIYVGVNTDIGESSTVYFPLNTDNEPITPFVITATATEDHVKGAVKTVISGLVETGITSEMYAYGIVDKAAASIADSSEYVEYMDMIEHIVRDQLHMDLKTY